MTTEADAPSGVAASEALDEVIRSEGRMVLATLARLTGDLALAEDAVQDAAISALETWRRARVPENPRAWLILAAKRRAIDLLRRDAARNGKEKEAIAFAVQSAPDEESASVIRDDRLRLVFVCCHPALAIKSQVALSLRLLCGLPVAQVARALLVSESTMARRLTRAKKKIADAGIPYRVPDAAELPDRLAAVAATMFLMFNEGYVSLSADGRGASVADEAIRLTRTLQELMPGEATVQGLLATMLLQHSRREARTNAAGDIVLLRDQDRRRWDEPLAREGIDLAAQAVRRSATRPDRFAVTAAIAACHALAEDYASTDWDAIISWYDVLVALDPNPVVALNRAAAMAERDGAAAALEEVESLADLGDYFWFHATRAELLSRLGRSDAAAHAAREALALSDSSAHERMIRRKYLD